MTKTIKYKTIIHIDQAQVSEMEKRIIMHFIYDEAMSLTKNIALVVQQLASDSALFRHSQFIATHNCAPLISSTSPLYRFHCWINMEQNYHWKFYLMYKTSQIEWEGRRCWAAYVHKLTVLHLQQQYPNKP